MSSSHERIEIVGFGNILDDFGFIFTVHVQKRLSVSFCS